jgi:hypothetical protein
MSIKQAFYQVCEDAEPAKASYVSLYVSLPYYGGPEEGGWWGSDTELVAYKQVSSDVEAQAVSEKVHTLSEQLSKDAKDAFNRHCANQCEWVEQHDPMADVDDYFPEVDGEERYWVAVEDRPGSLASRGSRHYE